MALFVWMEGKGAALIQDRRGPGRAELGRLRLGGLVHMLADGIKLLSKENVCPSRAGKALFFLAPLIPLGASFAAATVVPFTQTLDIGFEPMALSVSGFGSGLIFALAMLSLSTYGAVLAGYASGSTAAFLGGMRAAAQPVTFLPALGLSAAAFFLVTGSPSLSDAVMQQQGPLWAWNVLRQPLTFIIFTTAAFIGAFRLPFDLSHAEQESVAFDVEYGGARLGLFRLGACAHIVVMSAVIAALFLGGWAVPFVDSGQLLAHARSLGLTLWVAISMAFALPGLCMMGGRRQALTLRGSRESVVVGAALLLLGVLLAVLFATTSQAASDRPIFGTLAVALVQVAVMLLKTIAVLALFVWARWTFPRFRYDRLMAFGWKVLLPLALANIAITAFAVMMAGG